ncbi:MAG: hypothetical protein WC813_00825 [Patescibacteria group bacterium]|jgi:hypothetical protein
MSSNSNGQTIISDDGFNPDDREACLEFIEELVVTGKAGEEGTPAPNATILMGAIIFVSKLSPKELERLEHFKKKAEQIIERKPTRIPDDDDPGPSPYTGQHPVTTEYIGSSDVVWDDAVMSPPSGGAARSPAEMVERVGPISTTEPVSKKIEPRDNLVDFMERLRSVQSSAARTDTVPPDIAPPMMEPTPAPAQPRAVQMPAPTLGSAVDQAKAELEEQTAKMVETLKAEAATAAPAIAPVKPHRQFPKDEPGLDDKEVSPTTRNRFKEQQDDQNITLIDLASDLETPVAPATRLIRPESKEVSNLGAILGISLGVIAVIGALGLIGYGISLTEKPATEVQATTAQPTNVEQVPTAPVAPAEPPKISLPTLPPETTAAKPTFTVISSYALGDGQNCVVATLKNVDVTTNGQEEITICGQGVAASATGKGLITLHGAKLAPEAIVDEMRKQKSGELVEINILGATVYCPTTQGQTACTRK